MPSLSGSVGPREDREDSVNSAEPLLGIVPARMGYVRDWRENGETLELYLDRRKGDGYLVLASSKFQGEHAATIFHLGETLRGIIWRGLASDRSGTWKAAQQSRIAAAVAREAPDQCEQCGEPTTSCGRPPSCAWLESSHHDVGSGVPKPLSFSGLVGVPDRHDLGRLPCLNVGHRVADEARMSGIDA